ncbi:MAG: hypothetical protein PHF24_03860, partial [Syntrophomonas sp.]|nr:hypothetical protein [Syntrophomonas sp.]
MQLIIKKKKLWGSALGLILLAAIVWMYVIKTPAYSVTVDGNSEFIVENSADVIQALEQILEEE